MWLWEGSFRLDTISSLQFSPLSLPLKKAYLGGLQDGGRVRCGDHLPPHKYIKSTSSCETTPTEHQESTSKAINQEMDYFVIKPKSSLTYT